VVMELLGTDKIIPGFKGLSNFISLFGLAFHNGPVYVARPEGISVSWVSCPGSSTGPG
jgi:hypothetical protein